MFRAVVVLSLMLAMQVHGDTLKVRPCAHNEWEIIDVAAQLLPKEPVVIEGGYCPYAHHRMSYIWPKGRVYLFEPNPGHLQSLAVKIHYYPNTELFPYALSEKSGMAPFYISTPEINPRVGSLLPSAPEWNWYYTDTETITVECKNLQQWADEKGVTAVDFIYLDIGGMELNVLKSSPRLMETVKVVLLETHEKEFRQGLGLFTDVVSFLDGYDLELIHQWKVYGYQGYSLFMKRGLAEVIRW